MPTLLIVNGIRFFFYSNENKEPIHVHVTKGSAAGKVWLEPITEVGYFNGFSKAEEKLILEIVELHIEEFKTKWNEHFSK
jgi:hypothetical protein